MAQWTVPFHAVDGPRRAPVTRPATKKRRTQWASREDAWWYFHTKSAFARWDERILSDYIDFAIPAAHLGSARVLVFDRHVEYLIYRTLPHTLGARLVHGAPMAVGFIAGTYSVEVRHVGLGMTRRIADPLEWMEGSYLFPMERPLDTARAIGRQIRALARNAEPAVLREAHVV